MTNDLDRARSALQAIPPDCDRASWVKAGMSFHANGGDFDTFDQWSAQAPSYNAQACRATWRSFKTAPGGVGAGALFGMARDHGWREDGQTRARTCIQARRATAQACPWHECCRGLESLHTGDCCTWLHREQGSNRRAAG